MQNSMVMSIFSIFDQKYNFWENLVQKFQIVVLIWNCVHRLIRISRIQWWYSLFLCNTGYYNTFWTNLVQKIKIVSLIWNLVSRLIRIYRIQCWCSVSYFRPKILFLGKFGSKIKIVSLSWNLIRSLIRICRIQWWCSFSLFSTATTILGKFVPKNQNFLLKLKVCTQINSNMENSMVIVTFFIFDWKYPFWAKLAQKIKIFSLSWKLVPRVIRINRIELVFTFSIFVQK